MVKIPSHATVPGSICRVENFALNANSGEILTVRETYVAKLGEEKEEGGAGPEFLVSISRVRLMEEILAEICKMTALITTVGAKEVSSLPIGS
jgi:hypothetical protein